MFELTAEAIILLVRLALVALLYLFLTAIAITAVRELRRLGRETSLPRRGAAPAQLLVMNPGATSLAVGEALPLRTVTRLGRAPDNSVVLDATFVSAEHAVIFERDGGWWLADRGSTNGTVVNDRLVRGEVGLRPGDVVAIGDVRLKVVL